MCVNASRYHDVYHNNSAHSRKKDNLIWRNNESKTTRLRERERKKRKRNVIYKNSLFITWTIPYTCLQICDIWNREERVSLFKKKKRKEKRFELLRLIIKWYHYKVHYATANEIFRFLIIFIALISFLQWQRPNFNKYIFSTLFARWFLYPLRINFALFVANHLGNFMRAARSHQRICY